MKRNILFSLLASLLLFLGSCENNFDPKIYGSLLQGKYPSTENEYVSYMMTCYVPFTTVWTYDIGTGGVQHGFYIPAGGTIRMFDSTSDVMAPTNIRASNDWLRFTQGNFENCYYYWRPGINDDSNLNNFPKIPQVTRFTEIIGTLEKAPETILSAEKKKNLLGEARLCRGLMMYYLLHIYGPVPVITNPEDVFNQEALENAVRPSLDDMTRWITNDFEFAVANAPEKVQDLGRYTADYARFCLMKHCLNEGGHMEGYYQRVLDMYKELKGKYSLYTKGSNPYADQFKIANKFNSEVIMAVSCDASADGNPKHGNFNPLSWMVTPNDVSKVDDKGNPTPFSLQGKGWTQYYNFSPKFYDTFEPGDKRIEPIITDYWAIDGDKLVKTKKEDIGIKWDGYICYKFPVETSTPFQGTDIPLARWADVLLMYAEAEVRKSNAAPSNDAVKAVNEVRNRAGLGDLPASAIGSQEAFLDAILTERGHELYFEGCRKIDLIRFNQYAKRAYAIKKLVPTKQYMPLPNYAVDQAKASGKNLEQTYERPGWAADKASATGI